MATGCDHKHIRHGEAGFSLLEVLVSLFVMALATGTVLLTLSLSDDALEKAARRLWAKALVAQEQAEVSGRTLALSMDEDGYRFQRWTKDRWQTISEDPRLAGHNWPSAATVRVRLNGAEAPLPPAGGEAWPMVVFSPTGGISAFAVDLRPDSGRRQSVRVDESGQLIREEGA